jgi:hypothetical protein
MSIHAPQGLRQSYLRVTVFEDDYTQLNNVSPKTTFAATLFISTMFKAVYS